MQEQGEESLWKFIGRVDALDGIAYQLEDALPEVATEEARKLLESAISQISQAAQIERSHRYSRQSQ